MNKKSISKDSLVVQQVQVQYVVPGIDKKTAIFDILATDSEGRNRMTTQEIMRTMGYKDGWNAAIDKGKALGLEQGRLEGCPS